MIKIRKGNTRIALIFCNWIVVKFPNPRFDVMKNVKVNKKSITGVCIYLSRQLKTFYWAMVYGVAMNVSEAMLYLNISKTPFLTPVFTIGICNIQIYQGEDKPTWEELISLMKTLPEDVQVVLYDCDPHQWAPDNWRKTIQGLKLIDYAPDPLRTSWARLIRSHKKEIASATARK